MHGICRHCIDDQSNRNTTHTQMQASLVLQNADSHYPRTVLDSSTLQTDKQHCHCVDSLLWQSQVV